MSVGFVRLLTCIYCKLQGDYPLWDPTENTQSIVNPCHVMSVHWSGASCEPWGRNERSNQKCIYAWSLVEETYRRLSLLYDIRPRHWGVGRNKQRRTLHDIVQKGLAMFNLCSLFFFARLLFCSSFFDLSCGFSSLPGWSCAIGSSHLIPSLPHSHPITTLSLPFLLLIGPMRSWNPGKISKLACECLPL